MHISYAVVTSARAPADSRACICITEPSSPLEKILALSRDHKPSDATEATRISAFYAALDLRTARCAAIGGAGPGSFSEGSSPDDEPHVPVRHILTLSAATYF